MKKFLSILLMLTLALPFVFTAACDNDANKIRLNEVTHSVFYAPLYVAMNEGYFEQEGLSIELTNGGGTDKTMTAVLSGQADIGLGGPESAIYVHNEGRSDLPIIFAQLTDRDGSFLVSKVKDDNFSWSKLAGKEVLGGRKGGVPSMTLEYVLRKQGILQQVDFRYDIQYDLMIPSFESNIGDYCTMFEPAASNFVQAGKGYIVASVGEAAGSMPFTCFMANRSYMNANPQKIEAFTRALIKGMKFVQEKTPLEVAKAVVDSFAATEVSTLESAIANYKRIGAYCVSPVMSAESFDRLQQVIIEAGIMEQKASFSAVVDNTIAQKFI